MNKYRVFYKLRINKYFMGSTCEIVEAPDESTARAIIKDKYTKMSVDILTVIQLPM